MYLCGVALAEDSFPLPPPGAIPILERMRANEPRAVLGQPPVVWNRAHGFQVEDPWGNCWLDWSSGVLVANAGHGLPEVSSALCEISQRPLHYSYWHQLLKEHS